MQLETVSGMFSKLVYDGFIEVKLGQPTIKDIEALRGLLNAPPSHHCTTQP